jgi:hypothetical protein
MKPKAVPPGPAALHAAIVDNLIAAGVSPRRARAATRAHIPIRSGPNPVRRYLARDRHPLVSGDSAPAPIVALIHSLPQRGTRLVLPRCPRCGKDLIAGLTFDETAQGWSCAACQRPTGRCGRCGRRTRLRIVTPTHQLCAPCVRLDRTLWPLCPRCGKPSCERRGSKRCRLCRLTRDVPIERCVTCGVVHQRDRTQCVKCELRAFVHDALDRAAHLHPWRDFILTDVATRRQVKLSDFYATYGNAIRELGRQRTLDLAWLDAQQPRLRAHLVAELTACGILRGEAAGPQARFERWLARFFAEDAGADLTPEHRSIVERYFRWHISRRDRARAAKQIPPEIHYFTNRCNAVRAITKLLLQLHSGHASLAHCTVAHLQRFHLDRRRSILVFMRWARRHGLTHCRVPPEPKTLVRAGVGGREREDTIARLLHDESMPLRIRVAGLLVHCGFGLLQIVQIRLIDVIEPDRVTIVIGAAKYGLRRDVGALVARLRESHDRATRNQHLHGSSTWLFPGLFVGRHLEAESLGTQLRRWGIAARLARNAFFLIAAQRLLWLIVALRALNKTTSSLGTWRKVSNGRYAAYFGNLAGPPARRHASRV